MDESRFHSLADACLADLADRIEAALGDEVDVELQGGVMTLALTNGGQYVVNKHAPNRQIWLSSPKSGASHFEFRDGDWRATRVHDQTLEDVLADELGF